MTAPFFTIVVPCLDEERYIARAIEGLLAGEGDCELIVVDGGSRDSTLAIVEALAAADPRVRMMHNPGRLQSSGVNLAVAAADPRSSHVVRADAHATYARGFAGRVVSALVSTGADSVVVPMVTVGGEGCFQDAAAAAQNSRLGNGGSAHRAGAEPGWIEHGHHAGFLRSSFERLGGYDESFATNEDAEYDHRLSADGGRIWMAAGEPVTYHPRRDPLSLARQYRRHGRGRAMTVFKHRMRPKPRQMAPLAAFLGCAVALVLAAHCPVFLLVPAAYLALCLAVGSRGQSGCGKAAGLAAAIMHLSWGAGFAWQAMKSMGTARAGSRP